MRQKAVKTAKRYQRIRDLSCEIQRIQSKDSYLWGPEQLLKNYLYADERRSSGHWAVETRI